MILSTFELSTFSFSLKSSLSKSKKRQEKRKKKQQRNPPRRSVVVPFFFKLFLTRRDKEEARERKGRKGKDSLILCSLPSTIYFFVLFHFLKVSYSVYPEDLPQFLFLPQTRITKYLSVLITGYSCSDENVVSTYL